jgi:hypothetical protein
MERLDVLVQDLLVEVDVFSQVLPNLGLIQRGCGLKELHDALDLLFNRLLRYVSTLQQVVNAVLRLQVELNRCLDHLILDLPRLLYVLQLIALATCHHLTASHRLWVVRDLAMLVRFWLGQRVRVLVIRVVPPIRLLFGPRRPVIP